MSTGTQGGGQETTVLSALSTLVHHGILFVPVGYGLASPILSNVDEVRGGESLDLSFFLVLLMLMGVYRLTMGRRHLLGL